MIGEPHNDRACLGQVTELARQASRREDMRELASRFGNTQTFRDWIRGLPQRDDEGNLSDGPRITCDVPQRVRLSPGDPNCVERSLLYLAAGEVLDPKPVRRLVTIDTPVGRHTFPTEGR